MKHFVLHFQGKPVFNFAEGYILTIEFELFFV